ncbi:dendritic cell-specific transmembrane protein-like [Scyliorhinus canicula]|uniref:dendritic cell-specific transmembrane protein-like n=1 Tax=Scyliorhinus canicula TaxID=7830 RepID=UPI0018F65B9B|nr:dendritic cell-specific transmembrane protein-like [Scyliorhinus canicula]
MSLLKVIKQQLEILWGLFASERKSGLKNVLCLISLCLLMGLGASGILYMSLRALQCSLLVALSACGAFAAVIPGALFLSKYLRCFILIFLISCGTKQGRNTLITAGTGVVLYNCAQNSFHNLRGLAQCIVCYLVDKISSIKSLLERYVEIIEWLPQKLRDAGKKVHVKIPNPVVTQGMDEELQNYLNVTSHQLENLSQRLILTFDTVLMVSKVSVTALGILFVLVGTGLYIRKYLHNIEFENIFITKQFVEMDERKCNQGEPPLFPLTKKEKKCFIKIPSWRLTTKEQKITLKFFTPIFANSLLWAIIILIDYGLYLLISSIRIHFVSLPNMTLGLSLQAGVSYEGPLFKSDCFPHTTLTIDGVWIPLAQISSVLVLLTLLSTKLLTLKILVLSSFYPDAQRDRVYFLYDRITRKRSSGILKCNTKKSLKAAVNSVSFWFPIFKMKLKIEQTENNQ